MDETNCGTPNEKDKAQTRKCKIKRLPSYLEHDEVMRILDSIGNPRDKFLLSCLYYCGLRISEALQTKMSDFNAKDGILTIRAETAKRKKERHVPIPEAFQPLVKLWSLTLKDDQRPFEMCRSNAYKLCTEYAKSAGITKKCSPHTLRHSYASQVLGMTNNLKLVQCLLGHEHINTTARYLHLPDKVLKKGIEGVF